MAKAQKSKGKGNLHTAFFLLLGTSGVSQVSSVVVFEFILLRRGRSRLRAYEVSQAQLTFLTFFLFSSFVFSDLSLLKKASASTQRAWKPSHSLPGSR